MNPKISLIVPVFNVEKYVSKCLDSLVAQTLKDIEIICVDDCSTDNSLQIIEKYAAKDARIKIFKHEVNKCVGQARNTGLEHAVGEYIWFVDSDDCVDTKACQILYKTAKEYEVDMVSFQALCFIEDETGNEVYSPSYLINDWPKNVTYDLTTSYNLNGNQNITVWSYIVKRTFISDFIFRPGVFHEDIDFTLKLLSQCKSLRNIAYAPYYYRQDNFSITRSKLNLKRLIDNIKTSYSLKAYIDEKHFPRKHFFTDTYISYCNSVKKMIEEFQFNSVIPNEITEFNIMYKKLMISEKKQTSLLNRIMKKLTSLLISKAVINK